MRPALMEKSEEERQALLEKIPEKPRRERQMRLVKFGLDAPDVADAVNTYRRTILDMEEVLQRTTWISGEDFSLSDVCLAPYFQTLVRAGLFSSGLRTGGPFRSCRGLWGSCDT